MNTRVPGDLSRERGLLLFLSSEAENGKKNISYWVECATNLTQVLGLSVCWTQHWISAPVHHISISIDNCREGRQACKEEFWLHATKSDVTDCSTHNQGRGGTFGQDWQSTAFSNYLDAACPQTGAACGCPSPHAGRPPAGSCLPFSWRSDGVSAPLPHLHSHLSGLNSNRKTWMTQQTETP